ncbi:MAG: sigma-70 family RNA polymerase sigma factor [Steroidobacteraceae bacterium]
MDTREDNAVQHPNPNPQPWADFTAFMRNYQNMVFSTAARIVANDAQAEDIAQQVFLKAYERFAELRSAPTAGGWLKTVTTNLSLNHLSRYRKRWSFFSELRSGDAADDAPELEFAGSDSTPLATEQQQRSALIEAALAKLPEHQRVPLVLFHFEDMPYQDIAERLKISLAKVKTDISRGRAALAATFGASGLLEASPDMESLP